MNRSLPNMAASMSKVSMIIPQSEVIMITTAQAPKIYPIHLLMTTNYRLPNDADR